MCGFRLVTKQSGKDGFQCDKVYIVETVDIDTEVYVAVTLDRGTASPVFIYSPEGGMAIEDVAEQTPEKIFKIYVDANKGLTEEDLADVPKNLGMEGQADKVKDLFRKVYNIVIEKDADMVEINPLVRLKNEDVMAIDAKVTIDDNAFFRQKELAEQEDLTNEDPDELAAKKWDLSYIHIGGNIGCLVNGAGLAMSTMDILQYYGGHPSNFLDVGGSAKGQAMTEAIKIVHDSDEVDAIFINIFGGILKCDELVKSVLEANEQINFKKPIVLRLKGTNFEEAQRIIEPKAKDLNIQFTTDFDTAAQWAVKAADSVAQ